MTDNDNVNLTGDDIAMAVLCTFTSTCQCCEDSGVDHSEIVECEMLRLVEENAALMDLRARLALAEKVVEAARNTIKEHKGYCDDGLGELPDAIWLLDAALLSAGKVGRNFDCLDGLLGCDRRPEHHHETTGPYQEKNK